MLCVYNAVQLHVMDLEQYISLIILPTTELEPLLACTHAYVLAIAHRESRGMMLYIVLLT